MSSIPQLLEDQSLRRQPKRDTQKSRDPSGLASGSNGILKENRAAGDTRAKNISQKMDFAYKRGKHEIPGGFSMLGSSCQANFFFSPALRDLNNKKIKTRQSSIQFWGSLCTAFYCMQFREGTFFYKVWLAQPQSRHFHRSILQKCSIRH